MRTEPPEALVLSDGEPWLASRTLRSLERLGVEARVADAASISSARRPLWLLRAGSIPLAATRSPPPSASGRPLAAFGATRGAPAWSALIASTGGDLARAKLPRVDSVLLERPELLGRAAVGRASAAALDAACATLVASGAVRAIRLPGLDVTFDPNLRVVEAVTTLHRGGAERVVLDLVRELRGSGHEVLVAVLDRASRATFDAPEGTVMVHELARARSGRIAALADLAIERGADIVHVHLADGDEVRLLARAGVPVVVTVHNAREGWPARLEPVDPVSAALVVACSLDVAEELRAAGGVTAPVRTIWNGIVAASPAARARDDGALVVLSVANHRPQKRLDRIPAIVAELRARGRDARAVLVGEPVRADPAALAVADAVRDEAKRLGVEDHVVLAGSRADLRPVYADADAVVSTSAFEGLSLVHLEALAAGVPLVAAAVSGTREMTRKHAHARVVPHDAGAHAFADAILAARAESDEPAGQGSRTGPALAPDFTAAVMAARHVELFRRALAPRRAGGGLVLVTNNFSTGGAQSSARRLLTTLATAGIRVRAAVLQEEREHPTPGRASLERAGIPVHVAPRAGEVDPLVTARDVAAFVDRAAPDAVLFWNVIPEHKVLLADMLLGASVWDVSPGEMYFASFERYFAAPRVGLPYLDAKDYGRLLTGAVVKYEGERARASQVLGCRVEVVPNGVVVPETVLRRAASGPIVVGTLARISPDKKLEQLVNAALAGGFELRIAGGVERGSEPYAEGLRARAGASARSNGASIVFVGEQDSAAFLGGVDLFAMVSEPSGCPNASLEAMAAGLAVVATDAGGAREQIDDGVTGIVVPRGDSDALAGAIAELARDSARREAMGDAGHARARSRFDVARMAADYARVCLGLDLGESGGARAAE